MSPKQHVTQVRESRKETREIEFHSTVLSNQSSPEFCLPELCLLLGVSVMSCFVAFHPPEESTFQSSLPLAVRSNRRAGSPTPRAVQSEGARLPSLPTARRNRSLLVQTNALIAITLIAKGRIFFFLACFIHRPRFNTNLHLTVPCESWLF